jgi:RNA polymerase sigma-70 factor (ECF subfamily)
MGGERGGVSEPAVLIEHLFRRQAGKMVAHLTRLLGAAHLDLAEEAVQDAMIRALQGWPFQGIPPNPEAWLFRVAQNAAIDGIRKRRLAASKEDAVLAELRSAALPSPEPEVEEQFRDDELRMVFLCCHPEIPRDAAVALSLKTAGGFGVREIARAFLADEAAVAQRLVRAKRLIRERSIAMEMPEGADLEARLDAVLDVIYLIFNEGYAAHEGDALIRHDLCGEALRLGRLVATSSLDRPKVDALVALMALQAARSPARVDALGDLVLLEDQDRGLWDQRLISMGFHHFEKSLAGEVVSAYHVEAAIAATHARGQLWPIILELYEDLMALNPSPVVALNRAVAVAKVHGAEAGLAALPESAKLKNYYLYLAVRGHLLADLGRAEEAAAAFRAALECPCSQPERRFLLRKLDSVTG